MAMSRKSTVQEHYKTMKGLIFGFLAATCQGLLVCIVKALMSHSRIGVFELLYQRSLMALLIVALLIKLAGYNVFDIKKESFKFVLCRTLSSIFGFMAELVAIQFIPPSKVVVIMYCPFIPSFLSYMFIRETITKYDAVSFVFCTIGVIMLTRPFAENKNNFEEYLGFLLAFSASVIFNSGFVALRCIRHDKINSWTITLLVQFVACLVLPSVTLTMDFIEN